MQKKHLKIIKNTILISIILSVAVIAFNAVSFPDNLFSCGKSASQCFVNGMEYMGEDWYRTQNDPQIIVEYDPGTTIALDLKFEKYDSNMGRIYCAEYPNGFSEDESFAYTFHNGTNLIRINDANVNWIRLDVCDSSDILLQLRGLSGLWGLASIICSIDYLFLIMLGLLIAIYIYNKRASNTAEISTNSNSKALCKRNIVILISVLFFLSLYVAIHLKTTCAPDEEMRYLVPQWIFNNNRLPIGNEKDIRSELWGFSYAFTPYLMQIFSAIFMKMGSLFTCDPRKLLVSARLVSVVSYMLFALVVIYIGQELFEKNKYKILLLLSITAFVPQVMFLSGYVNNDMPALCECAAIVLLWIRGYKYGWDNKRCVLIGILCGLCTLTYYNACCYIIISVIVCLYCTIIKDKLKCKDILTKAGITILCALFVAGWYFARNMVLYDGDALGLNTSRLYGEIYAIEGLKPSSRMNGFNMGMNFWDYFAPKGIFADNSWFVLTFKSIIGVFGYFTAYLKDWIYKYYIYLIITGVIGFVIFASSIKEKRLNKWFIGIVILMSVIFPWALSLYNSYYSDYQPQGRYVIASIIPVGICVTIGITYFFEQIEIATEKKGLSEVLTACLSIIMVMIGVFAVVFPMSTECFANLPF